MTNKGVDSRDAIAFRRDLHRKGGQIERLPLHDAKLRGTRKRVYFLRSEVSLPQGIRGERIAMASTHSRRIRIGYL